MWGGGLKCEGLAGERRGVMDWDLNRFHNLVFFLHSLNVTQRTV